eukprot:736341-Hanusia_phi.AAC.4
MKRRGRRGGRNKRSTRVVRGGRVRGGGGGGERGGGGGGVREFVRGQVVRFIHRQGNAAQGICLRKQTGGGGSEETGGGRRPYEKERPRLQMSRWMESEMVSRLLGAADPGVLPQEDSTEDRESI